MTKAEFCPTCGQKLANVDNSTKIEENNKSKQSLITKGVNEDKKLTQEEVKKELIFAYPVEGEILRDYAMDELIFSETFRFSQ